MSLDFEAMRHAMVESQLRPNAVSDARLIKAMVRVPREDFVPEEKRSLAYAEIMVPLTPERRMNVPITTGRLLSELRLRSDDTILIVGSGMGYVAAICADLVKTVVALEEDKMLARAAKKALSGLPNVEIVTGDLNAGWSKRAPYDAILIDGLIGHIPDEIVAQLADGGRLSGAVLEDGVSRLVYGRKHGDAFGVTAFLDAEAAPLPGFERLKEFAF